jgi:hypothetical protein
MGSGSRQRRWVRMGFRMIESTSDEQKRVVLTAHPLQRVGAMALCVLGNAAGPDLLTPEQFDVAVKRMTEDAIRAALVTSTKADDGFWLKASGSFFPNSPMNHPARLSKLDVLPAEVRKWRSPPPSEAWPSVGCALCARQAVGFYGKLDVALAESTAYRNTVPRGHGGLSLCWPCLCSFYALPYGCVLTGGQSSVLHSFDDRFLHGQVLRQVKASNQHITLGRAVVRGPLGSQAAALRRLRDFDNELRAGVDLMVFSNNNREQSLEVHSLTQPLAEWLRWTQRPSRRAGYAVLVRAHVTRKAPGLAGLARNAFHNPVGIVTAAAQYASRLAEQSGSVPASMGELAGVSWDFAERVLGVNDEDVKQVQALASNLATVISADTVRGPLTGLLRAVKNVSQLQTLMQTMSAKWLLSPPPGSSGPLLTIRQFRLLFDPDGQSWLYRQLLTIAVLQELCEQGWRPSDARDAVEELDSETQAMADIDDRYNGDEDGATV